MKIFLSIIITLLTFHVHAAGWEESQKVGEIFKNAGVNGTFVLYDVSTQTYIGHNRARAEKQFVPASTFKIANTLIGLLVGAVSSVDEVFPYGGQPQPFKAWEKSMGLREAITLSNVPVYQALAQRIGLERMRDNVQNIDYGNKVIGTVVDRFWLDGPLTISAVEQTYFLGRLAQGQLPIPEEFQESVREIILIEEGNNWSLYGKTGWENAPEPGIGWWVGWVVKEGSIYAFALNIDIQNETDAIKRLEIGKASLIALEIL